jgi:hypothetical protein
LKDKIHILFSGANLPTDALGQKVLYNGHTHIQVSFESLFSLMEVFEHGYGLKF